MRRLPILLILLVACSVPESEAVSRLDTKAKADSVCRAAVLHRVRAPSTAKFLTSVAYRAADDSTWHVTGTVAAENVFGGTVESTFFCDLYFSDLGAWQFEDVTMF